MSYPASISRPGSAFDAFLFAPIGEDGNGLSLSVVSALARMDLDPWQEAATLAGLPADAAAHKLAALFSALPDQLLSERSRDTTAARLISLLPRPADSPVGSLVGSPATPTGTSHPTDSRIGTSTLLFALYMLVLLASQFFMSRHDSPTPDDGAHAAPSASSPAQKSPPAPEE
ncbi:MAG: hypothetical protein WDO56_12500 [Gammaproteobacteria bacterium]